METPPQNFEGPDQPERKEQEPGNPFMNLLGALGFRESAEMLVAETRLREAVGSYLNAGPEEAPSLRKQINVMFRRYADQAEAIARQSRTPIGNPDPEGHPYQTDPNQQAGKIVSLARMNWNIGIALGEDDLLDRAWLPLFGENGLSEESWPPEIEDLISALKEALQS
jgi:hypothetical protein